MIQASIINDRNVITFNCIHCGAEDVLYSIIPKECWTCGGDIKVYAKSVDYLVNGRSCGERATYHFEGDK